MRIRSVVVASVVAAGVGVVTKTLLERKNDSPGSSAHPLGWKSVTILGDAEEFAAGGYPEPLQRLADVLEVRVQPAPGDRGFEVHARFLEGSEGSPLLDGDNPDEVLREALRDAKQLLEAGEVLQNTPRPHGARPTTLFGGLVDRIEEKSKGMGVL